MLLALRDLSKDGCVSCMTGKTNIMKINALNIKHHLLRIFCNTVNSLGGWQYKVDTSLKWTLIESPFQTEIYCKVLLNQ